MSGPPDRGLRVDKWLWFARFFKSRSIASAMCLDGRVRLDGQVLDKAHARVQPGQVLTFVQGRQVRVVRVRALGERRGPAPEAQALYEDLSPAAPALPHRPSGGARPTKRDRRAVDRLAGDPEDP